MTGRPLKIVITDPHLKGGGQVRYVATLARELSRLGHHVTIGCKTDSVLVGHAEDAGCPAYNRFRYRGGLRPRAWWNDVTALRRFILDERPDVLHANGSQDHWVSALTNRTMGRPVCMVRTRHNTYAVHDALPNRILNRQWTDYQVSVCETVRAGLVQQASFDSARMESIHNGVDPEQYRPDPDERRQARAQFGFDDTHVVLGMAARMNIAKGHRYLFEAAQQLKHEFPNARILLLGQGDLEDELKRRVSESGLSDIVTFAGFRNDMALCLQAFDIGVQPSIACEASSFSLMEQMATGNPIVTSDHGGSKEIVRHEKDGYVVPERTVEPLRDALRNLLSNNELREAMGHSARQRIIDDFSAQIFASRTVDAYRRAMELHAARTS
ncbi:MAG: glycosyltransferase family 4 protein [bacterium]|nr:glycosyltransferase family 4 protein [bacterium]